MKMLNLKELNMKQSSHISDSFANNNSIEEYGGAYEHQESSQAEENMSSTMNRFFQKRTRHSKMRSSGKQANFSCSSQDYSQPQEVTLLTQIARRRDYES
jgi:hypothetical protein